MHAACKGQTGVAAFLLSAGGASVDVCAAKDRNGLCAVLHAAAVGEVCLKKTQINNQARRNVINIKRAVRLSHKSE